ncbi:tetratricopeptide repeat protein [Altererythrobacter litoralis]|uniref:tetratricopeptide repeat protein n=1 Tax=Altererythrobacter litoralis TaxID=3113904 RepID=UPI00339A5CAD
MTKSTSLRHVVLPTALALGVPSTVLAQDSALWTNDAFVHDAQRELVNDGAAYFAMREEAISLVRAENWAEAKPLLESLTSQYADDGNTWYLLGLTCLQTGDWTDAISAMEKALSLGASIHAIPTGSPPSNDIMVRIAEAYAAMGDSENALVWADKALAARYDDRPFLGGRPHLANALTEEQYQRLLGTYLPANISRDEGWRSDLRTLVSEIARLHVAPSKLPMSSEEIAQRVAEIDAEIPSLSDQQVVFRFMELVGALGSGHNLILPTGAAHGSFTRLPLEFYWFVDGLYVVGANEEHKRWVGYRVEQIGNVSATEALERTQAVNARDNNMQKLWLAPYYVSLPELLVSLGIANSGPGVDLSLSHEGEKYQLSLSGTDWNFTGFPRLPSLDREAQPLYLSHRDRLYWSETLPEHDAIFVQFNWVQEYEQQNLASFSRSLIESIESTGANNLILDLRHNQGGNGAILPPLFRVLSYFEGARPKGRIFVIAGRGTFSAAHNLLTDIDLHTNAIIVGEPSGSRPNAISEAGWFQLPYSGLRGLISSQFHQRSEAEDHRIWIAPDVPVVMTSAEYFAGTDPAMEAIERIIAAD